MDAAAVEDREARLACFGQSVVADERRSPADLARTLVREERGDDVLALREVLDRPEVGLVLLEVRERGKNGEAEHRKRDDRADRRSDTERRSLEEARARVRRKRLLRGDRAGRRRSGLIRDGARLRLDRRDLVADVTRDVARPEEAEGDGDDRTDRGHDPADDQAEQETRHSDRECNRPQARARNVLGVVARIAHCAPCPGFNRPSVPRVNDVPSVATRGFCTLRRTRVMTSRQVRTRPSAALPARERRYSSRSPPAMAWHPPREACASRRCRASRRRTAARGRGRDGLAVPP